MGPGREAVRAALWDVSGSPEWKKDWAALAQVRLHALHAAGCPQPPGEAAPAIQAPGLTAGLRVIWQRPSATTCACKTNTLHRQGVDGVLLVIDPSKVDATERELESFYLHFAQPAGLTTKQVMVLALDVREGAAVGGNAAWAGERAAV